MNQIIRSIYLLEGLVCILGVHHGFGRPLEHYLGTFNICKNSIIVSRENLNKKASSVNQRGKTVRVCALIDEKTFSEQELRSLGWVVIYRIGDVAVLHGSEESEPYLSALDGIRMVESPWGIPLRINRKCMDSVRKETYVDLVQDSARSRFPNSYSGKKTLIGIIDTEFDTHHPDFLTADGKTRFIAVWDQTDTTDTLHASFTYGKIKQGQELESDPSFGLQGEFHGTMMASFAAGSQKAPNPPFNYYGIAPDAMIIGAKYSDNTEADVMSGLKWIFNIADSLGVPCVVSLSIGLAAGPHDGTSLTDRVIDSLSSRPGHIVVGAIGNDGDKRSHISFSLASGKSMGTFIEPQIDSLQNPPHSRSFCGIDVWGDSGKTISATFYILDKRTGAYKTSFQKLTTQNTQSFAPDAILWNNTIDNKLDTIVFYFLDKVYGKSPLNGKPHFEVAIESTNPNLILGMSVSLLYNGAGAVHAWNIEKLPFSNFNLDGFFNGDSVSTLNEIGGTAKKIISVGAYCSKWRFTTWNGLIFDRGIGIDTIWGKLSGFSGTGPSIDGRIKPDITAPGDMVVGAMSRLAVERGQTVIWPDTLSTNGRYTRGTGTSVSSPIVAGIIALMLQAKPDLSTEEARQILKATAIKDKFTGPLSFPNNLWGAGKVNAYGAIAQLLGINAVGKNKSETRPTLASPEIFYRRNQKMVAINFENKTQKIVQLFFYTLSGRLVVSKTLIHQTTSLPQELSKSAYIVELMVDGRQVAKRKLVIW